jgi:hypothetical protein
MHDTKGTLRKKDSVMVATSESQATLPPVTRRRFLETSVIAGAGTLLGTAPFARTRQAPLLDPPFYKGMCYSAVFPPPYRPDAANRTCIFFGSDEAYDCMQPLWGNSFTSANGRRFMGRDDLRTINLMGVNLIRLYDWEPRNYHQRFLDYCQQLGIKVLASVSDYFLNPDPNPINGGFRQREMHIPSLIKSFSNGHHNIGGTDYHPAIVGIIFGNEPEIHHKFGIYESAEFTKDWVRIEQQQFPGFRRPLIGHPVDFGKYGNEPYPQWNWWIDLLGRLAGTTTRDLQSRLFLAPQPQNDASYLFENAQGSGKGYVQLTYERFRKPLLFTEIGYNRLIPGYLNVVDGQLRESIAYGAAHPEQLLGICYFQFADKVWKCPTFQCSDTEGSFGAHSHTGTVLRTVDYVPGDFTHFDTGGCDREHLRVDELMRDPVYQKIVDNYIRR